MTDTPPTASAISSTTGHALDTLVFVYGTLKRGFLNYEDYIKPACAFGKAEYLCDGVTSHPDFCLVLRKERKVPCLYRPQQGVETGYAVPGEVFRVDKDALQALDILEGVDAASYYREEIDITLTSDGPTATAPYTKGSTIKCHIYLKVFNEKLVAMENVPSYTEEHHVAYVSRYRTPKLRILECVYGTHITDQVQQKLDQGISFEDAWKQVVG